MIFAIELKSIETRRQCVLMPFLLYLIFISLKTVDAVESYAEIIEDLPMKDDLEFYLTALEKNVDFCVRHKLYVDINLEFGLFLINVNLKGTLQMKKQTLPQKVRFRLEQLMLKVDVLENYFRYMVKTISKDNKKNEQDRRISKLFNNGTMWLKSIIKFNTDLLHQTKLYNSEQLEKIYGKWDNYDATVYDFTKYKPKPEDSDECVANMAQTPPILYRRHGHLSTDCNTPTKCKQGVTKGSEYGYGLSHRILFMVAAHFGRGCTVFSAKEDKYKVDKYCMRSFNEAQYIAQNNFKQPDLMMEQMALCGLFGHAQFNRNAWFGKLIKYQTPEGCFAESLRWDVNILREGIDDKWTISNSAPQNIMNGQCNSHTTAVAGAALSSALRYIMEFYY